MNFLFAYLPNAYNFVVCLRSLSARSALGFCRRSNPVAKSEQCGVVVALEALWLLESLEVNSKLTPISYLLTPRSSLLGLFSASAAARIPLQKVSSVEWWWH